MWLKNHLRVRPSVHIARSQRLASATAPHLYILVSPAKSNLLSYPRDFDSRQANVGPLSEHLHRHYASASTSNASRRKFAAI
jgi:hypothetical protein